jgi:hypothetical protein
MAQTASEPRDQWIPSALSSCRLHSRPSFDATSLGFRVKILPRLTVRVGGHGRFLPCGPLAVGLEALARSSHGYSLAWDRRRRVSCLRVPAGRFFPALPYVRFVEGFACCAWRREGLRQMLPVADNKLETGALGFRCLLACATSARSETSSQPRRKSPAISTRE